ncbi:MAG: TIGR03032 family protein [Gammaproteobacteria bacterium]
MNTDPADAPSGRSESPAATEALRSVHTANLPALFDELNISLVVSTYQAGKVIMVRRDGEVLNTHFRTFAKPMGIAADRARLTIGGTNTVWYYRNVPAVAPKLEPVGKHDACYLPRRIHVTGDIDIHEMAYDGEGDLWIVNTRFGCLCTLDAEHSFYPRWRAPFLSALAPEDRCHLNGLAMVAGKPKYLTALGETDTPGGWRANKASGGVLMDLERNEIVCRGLSMPHSPRWHQGRLWCLESGQGSLAEVDPETTSVRTVAQLPGFTRGIDFVGPLAFLGLSQVRESAVFSGIPLVKRLQERCCGVWVVHIESGETLGFLRFEAGVQEIFAVQVLPGMRYPEMLEWQDERLSQSYVLPDEALAQVVLPTEEEIRRSPGFHVQAGMEHYRHGRLKEAIAAYRECLRIDPAFPNARYNLGVALGDAEEFDEASGLLQAVIEAEPERAEAYNSLGYLHAGRGDQKTAIGCYEKAIALQPDYATAHFNLGITLLRMGDYPRGFAEYEWRWRTGQLVPFRCPHPQWDGRPIADKTLFVYAEQGAGDAIHFARYLPLVAERCRRLLLVCRADLLPVFATIAGITELREPGQFEVQEFDVHLPLLSLPRVFATTPSTIPARVPYVDVSAIRRRKDSDALPPIADSRLPKIGIVWAGSPTHKNDRRRSCPLGALVPLLRTSGVDFYSLQKGEPSRELAELPSEVTVQDLGPALHDYGDAALALDALDLLIGVDTSVVHLAGALGKPVWLLLSDVADWRWGSEGETTPWYSSVRLFRQAQRGDWTGVIARTVKALAQWPNAQGPR